VKILFIHQNFPGQFKFLAPALVGQGHEVHAMTMQKTAMREWQAVRLHPYSATRGTTAGVHPWVSDFETKVIRADACFRAALLLKQQGFEPDVIIAHHGWGESLFLKEVWPKAQLGIYCEFFYHPSGADVGFDPEFPSPDTGEVCRLQLKNLNNLIHFNIADAGLSPTHWQASTFPEPFRSKISVVHDGIDTAALHPNPDASLRLSSGKVLTSADEIVTFVNRNLEPYRGYHIFMRALPQLLRQRPQARILIVGGHDVSYGARPDPDRYGARTWKDIFIEEVRPQIAEQDWGRVHFLGNIPYDQFIALLQISSVHVYLTYPFVLSWSLLEAMSLGCTIVASRTAPLAEAIVADQTGVLVDFFDFRELAQQITGLLADPGRREHLSCGAREFASTHYDLRSVCLPRQLDWVSRFGR
jgi:glycosyltransferase involved in cell wall biosynthesis